jgi:dolichol-phosphate mannosyltransferase
MVPTYNESGNVLKLYTDIRKLVPFADLLFIDDNSPDGTGNIIDDIIKSDPKVFVKHRSGKLGVGSAHYEGISWAYDQSYDYLLTMDCDFTHPPKYILNIIEKREAAEVLVGSRFIQENSLTGWNMIRKILTWTGHVLTTYLLDLPYDATGGFRLYNLKKVPRQAFELVSSLGYSFFFESLFILNFNKVKIKEIPIELPPRTYGSSKMTVKDIFRSLKLLVMIYSNKLVNEERYVIAEPLSPKEINTQFVDKQDWDQYWKDKKTSGRILYDIVAAFYRKFIIKRNLNYFITHNFKQGSQVLHAGCGSGQVDKDICDYVNVTGLDISVNALNFYKRTNKGKAKVIHGSIFQMPVSNQSFDGIYNLGVMEHFETQEIDLIMKEFKRVLKPQGKIVIFWPPEFGLSVIFFKVLTFVFKNFLGKKDVKFHPDEISRVKSRDEVSRVFEKNGFSVSDYYFGPRDLFTYSIIVGENK